MCVVGYVFLNCSLLWNVRKQQKESDYFLYMLNSGGESTYR